jgi:hypothetical protein
LKTVNVLVVPDPNKDPLIAEPVPDVIVKSVETKPAGAALKVKSIAVVTGLPIGVAVQEKSVTVLDGELVTLPELSERVTVTVMVESTSADCMTYVLLSEPITVPLLSH